MARLLKQGSVSALGSYKAGKTVRNDLIGGNWSMVPPRGLLHIRIGRMKVQSGHYRVCYLVL